MTTSTPAAGSPAAGSPAAGTPDAGTPDARAAPGTLGQHHDALADAIRQVLDGPTRRHEQVALLSLRGAYEAALRHEAEQLVTRGFAATGDETATRADLVTFATDSVTDVVGSAQSDHYESSIVERVRHFFELTGRRRLAAALINALVFAGLAALAVRTVEAMPGVNNVRALATGAGVLGFALRYVRPREIARALVRSSGHLIRDRAVRAGVNKYPGDVIREIRHEVAEIHDRDLRRRTRYELLAERHYGTIVRLALSEALLELHLATPGQQQRAAEVAARTAVEWLYAQYGIDLSEEEPLRMRRWRRTS